ncbi:LysM domain-containing protein [Sphingobium sp. HBC34]|uniref:LysM domain-containing protein n=1 Tax=Sphingobium cyanobacteriorum TaxID=3063954 RepID=A0ABT8ZQY9_9SPHN|nr:LysM domain-containing protein [Sphingobium sp. HBC34]MDO7836617.1 LysM domain-containing protein [Sphingobium sp. HBC34]
MQLHRLLPGGQDRTASSYTVQAGDTLEGIALALWGDASFWYMIAETNGLTGSDRRIEGSLLAIPSKVHNARNSADTWKVYAPNLAIGDASPIAPAAPKPKRGKCGAFSSSVFEGGRDIPKHQELPALADRNQGNRPDDGADHPDDAKCRAECFAPDGDQGVSSSIRTGPIKPEGRSGASAVYVGMVV